MFRFFLSRLALPFLMSWSWLFEREPQLHKADSPSLCLQQSKTLEHLAECLEDFIPPRGHYDQASYHAAQPDVSQRAAWSSTISSLLEVDGNCSSIRLPDVLRGLYDVTTFVEDSGASFCVFFELTVDCRTYRKGWGAMIVPARREAVSRHVHISAPHPGFDAGTPSEASYVFKATGSKSFLMAGRTRTAFLNPSPCVSTASLSGRYYETDPAHNNREPFFDASLAIYDWQQRRGCPSSKCAYIQLHGKGSSTCPLDQIFLSAGLGHSSTSKAWYIDSNDRPVKRLQGHLQLAFPTWNVSLPSDSPCALTATRNVVGRYINGVDEHSVCSRGADPTEVSGEFIHVEQDDPSRGVKSYKAWAGAVRRTFETICAEGMAVDPDTELCAFSRPRVVAGDPVLEPVIFPILSRNVRTQWLLWMSLLNIL